MFPASVAATLGIDLASTPTGSGTGVAMANVSLIYAQVMLRLTDGREFREWPATVAFTSSRLPYPMLGFAGCLQYFTATFFGDREEVELSVNGLYPGT